MPSPVPVSSPVPAMKLEMSHHHRQHLIPHQLVCWWMLKPPLLEVISLPEEKLEILFSLLQPSTAQSSRALLVKTPPSIVLLGAPQLSTILLDMARRSIALPSTALSEGSLSMTRTPSPLQQQKPSQLSALSSEAMLLKAQSFLDLQRQRHGPLASHPPF